jgi:predicted RNA-binding Zn-ribbon protein involved in translation (DUF1610 family)
MSFTELLEKLQQDYPNINFVEGENFSWNSQKQQITYTAPIKRAQELKNCSKLLHELAHGLLNHQDYHSDVNLLKIESEAWNKASVLAKSLGIDLDSKEQQSSLASYINWAASRSKCPSCHKNGLQIMQTSFICPNCQNKWQVSKSRFTRTYRQKKNLSV